MARYVSMSSKLALFVLLTALIGGATRTQAQSYPTSPVKIISDSAPGSAVDTNLRIIAEGLGARWGQQVVIENRPGAGGSISATAAAEAKPDGYTIYAPALSVFLTIPGKAPNLPLHMPRDFVAIGLTAEQPMSIGINPKLGINTLSELIAQAKKQPGSLSFAVTGVGRLTHLTGELLQIRGDIKLQMVPYTGGSAQALADIVAGRVSLVIEGYSGLAGAYELGQLKALAIAASKSCARPAQSADRGGNAARLCRRRLAVRSGAGRNAAGDRAKDQRRPARSTAHAEDQGQACSPWQLRASGQSRRSRSVRAQPAGAVEASAGAGGDAVQEEVAIQYTGN